MKLQIIAIVILILNVSPLAFAMDHAIGHPSYPYESLQQQLHRQEERDFEAACISEAEMALGLRASDVEDTELRTAWTAKPVVTFVYLKLKLTGRIVVYRTNLQRPI